MGSLKEAYLMMFEAQRERLNLAFERATYKMHLKAVLQDLIQDEEGRQLLEDIVVFLDEALVDESEIVLTCDQEVLRSLTKQLIEEQNANH